MENAQSILVIIVSALLSIFLIVSIVLLVAVVKLVKALRELVAQAHELLDSAEAATDILKNVGGPLAFFKIIRNVMKTIDKLHKK